MLLFTKGATTNRIWFYDMEADGLSLDDKRDKVPENDIPDLLTCWKNRADAAFQAQRQARREALRAALAPRQAERLALEGEIHRLTFDQAISPTGDGPVGEALQEAKARLEALNAELQPLRAEYNQLSRQFWVTKEQVRANKYDLTASRYRQVEGEEEYFEKPEVTIERMRIIEEVIGNEITGLKEML